METLKLTLEAIRMNMGLTRSEMAEKMGISLDRYARLANGESRMLATELVDIHNISGVPYENIAVGD